MNFNFNVLHGGELWQWHLDFQKIGALSKSFQVKYSSQNIAKKLGHYKRKLAPPKKLTKQKITQGAAGIFKK
jgi:hypothetical protein